MRVAARPIERSESLCVGTCSLLIGLFGAFASTAPAAEFVPLGVGAWETSGEYFAFRFDNGIDISYLTELVYPIGTTPSDAFVIENGVPKLPDGSLPSPTAAWDNGFERVLISDDGRTVAGSTSASIRPLWFRFGPNGEMEQQLTYQSFTGADNRVAVVDLTSDGSLAASTRNSCCFTRDRSFGRSSGLNLPGSPEFGLGAFGGDLPPELEFWVVAGAAGVAAISGDSTVLVGTADNDVPFRWDERDGRIRVLEGMTEAVDVSSDGSVVVGGPHRWTVGDGAELLGPEPTSIFDYEAIAVSGAGDAVAGTMRIDGVQQAFRWTAEAGIEALGELPGGSTSNVVTAMSADGETIVGQSTTTEGVVPFRWNAATGMQSIESLLTQGGADLVGYDLHSTQTFPTRAGVTGVSGDGTILVGTGLNAAGQTSAWLARLAIVPEPSSIVLIGLACGAGLRQKRAS